MSSLFAKTQTPAEEALQKALEEQTLLLRQLIKGHMSVLAVHYKFQNQNLRHLEYISEILNDPVGVIKFHIVRMTPLLVLMNEKIVVNNDSAVYTINPRRVLLVGSSFMQC